MKYISLFSGIGGFEVAIHRKWPNAVCLGYSEIKPSAIKVYETHFPDHINIVFLLKVFLLKVFLFVFSFRVYFIKSFDNFLFFLFTWCIIR